MFSSKMCCSCKKISVSKKLDLTGRIYIFDDSDVYQLDSIVEEVFEDWMRFSRRLNSFYQLKVNFVPREKLEDDAVITWTNSQKNLYDPIDEQSELDVKVHENGRGGKSVSSESKLKWAEKDFRYRDIGASFYCKLAVPYCNP